MNSSHYINEDYGKEVAITSRRLYAYVNNRIRDTCIVSLILNSGLRVSEVYNMNVDDIDLKKRMLYVYRKGKNDDTFKTPVYFRQEAMRDIEKYLVAARVAVQAAKTGKSTLPRRCQWQEGRLTHDEAGYSRDGHQICEAVRQTVSFRT